MRPIRRVVELESSGVSIHMKRGGFTILWMFVSFIVGCILFVGVIMAVNFKRAAQGDTSSSPPNNQLVNLAIVYSLPTLALILGVMGKLPGTRSEKSPPPVISNPLVPSSVPGTQTDAPKPPSRVKGYGQKILNQGLNEDATYSAVSAAIHKKYPLINDKNLLNLTPGERAFILTIDLSGRVSVGGFDAYFLNTQCRALHETMRSFLLIGATKDLDIIRRAAQAARIPEPLPAGFEYCFPDEDTTEMDAALHKLTSEFYKAGNGKELHHLLIEHFKKHPEEFV